MNEIPAPGTTTLIGRRVILRPLRREDFPAWREVRRRNHDWLTKWEPIRPPGTPDVIEDGNAFALRCHARHRDWQMGSGFGFGVFVAGHFAGEVNINSVQRGAFQNGYVGYWVDEARAGNGYVPEALVHVLKFGFETLGLHRLQIAIVPRNAASLRVVHKLGIRSEGVAQRYLEINGTWEDHERFAMTAEEWTERGAELTAAWL